jgi:metallophosphoesterase (TIGR03768 family)
VYPKILPNDQRAAEEHSYGSWYFGPGEKLQVRKDLLPSASAHRPLKADETPLLRFFTMSDIHITDVQSPVQTIYLGITGQAGLSSAYSPVIVGTTQVLDSAIQTVNQLDTKTPVDFGVFLGDAVNNTQRNELRWYLDVIDGNHVIPNSNASLKSSAAYVQPFTAAGLKSTIPWYQVLGNHDHFWSGMFPANDLLQKTAIGNRVLNVGNLITDPKAFEHPGFYTGVVDGSTSTGQVQFVGPQEQFPTPPEITANADRHLLSRKEWMSQFFETKSAPVGHGFSKESLDTGDANYTFEPKSAVPVRVIVLDDTEVDTETLQGPANGASGRLTPQRFEWLKNELKKGQADDKLLIIAAHVPIGVDTNLWDKASSPTEKELITELKKYPNLILWIAGHRHLNTVTAFPSDAIETNPELGFWEVETASLRDFPQQFRMFELFADVAEKTVTIQTVSVDPDVKEGSVAAESRKDGIRAAEIFSSIPNAFPGPHNVQLIKKISPQMVETLQKPSEL